MLEGLNYQKEKRKKRFFQKNRKKAAELYRHDKGKRGSKYVVFEDRYLGYWDLINAR